jgi:hypothetical protein
MEQNAVNKLTEDYLRRRRNKDVRGLNFKNGKDGIDEQVKPVN